MTEPRALCVGKHVLFDSTNPADHQLARQFCDACPLADACEQHLTNVRRTAACGCGPEGTWAGRLISTDRIGRLKAEEDSYSPDEARRAHAAHQRGDTSRWAETGERVYQRRIWREKKRRQRDVEWEAS